MINDYLMTPFSGHSERDIYAELFTRHGSGEVDNRQVRLGFLQQSARYLGANLGQHELLARFMQD